MNKSEESMSVMLKKNVKSFFFKHSYFASLLFLASHCVRKPNIRFSKAIFIFAEILLQKGNKKRAYKYLNLCSEFLPDHENAKLDFSSLCYISQVYYYQERYEKSLSVGEQAFMSCENKYETRCIALISQMMLVASLLEDPKKYIDLYQKLTKYDINNAYGHHTLGYILFKQRRYDEAYDYFHKYKSVLSQTEKLSLLQGANVTNQTAPSKSDNESILIYTDSKLGYGDDLMLLSLYGCTPSAQVGQVAHHC